MLRACLFLPCCVNHAPARAPFFNLAAAQAGGIIDPWQAHAHPHTKHTRTHLGTDGGRGDGGAQHLLAEAGDDAPREHGWSGLFPDASVSKWVSEKMREGRALLAAPATATEGRVLGMQAAVHALAEGIQSVFGWEELGRARFLMPKLRRPPPACGSNSRDRRRPPDACVSRWRCAGGGCWVAAHRPGARPAPAPVASEDACVRCLRCDRNAQGPLGKGERKAKAMGCLKVRLHFGTKGPMTYEGLNRRGAEDPPVLACFALLAFLKRAGCAAS